MMMSFKQIIFKEFIHISRDRQTLVIILLIPVLMLMLFGYAITLEMRNIPTWVVDQNRTPVSRQLINQIGANGFFHIRSVSYFTPDVNTLFQQRTVKCIIIIPYDYAQSLQDKPKVVVQVLIDASDPNVGNLIQKYLAAIASNITAKINPFPYAAFTLEPRFLYNPDLKSVYFFVPGLVAVIMLLISALLSSIAIVREKETGTMEQISVTPIRSVDIVFGKLIPYLVVSLMSGVIVLLFAVVLFRVPLHGSLLLLLFAMLVYILTGLSLGLLISIQAKTQQIAMMMTMVITILPTTMLSGFMFPLDSMPIVFKYASTIIPATHFIQIIRGIMLKGTGIAELTIPFASLGFIALVLIVLSIKKFKLSLD